MAVEPVIRDLRTTWWGFETRERVLFPGDGFAYSHYHEDGHCGLVAEEAVSLDLPDVSSTFADLALFWTKFADMNVYCDRLDHLIERLGVKTIAPTHGLPITDVKATVPKVQEGLKAAALMPKSGTNEKVPLTGAAPRQRLEPPTTAGSASMTTANSGLSLRPSNPGLPGGRGRNPVSRSLRMISDR